MLLRNQVYKHEGCLPQKIPISSFLQLPFWMYLTSAIRSLTFGIHGNYFKIDFTRNKQKILLL